MIRTIGSLFCRFSQWNGLIFNQAPVASDRDTGISFVQGLPGPDRLHGTDVADRALTSGL
jgi:hypothetical protein